jgi:hypothetical protein
MSAKDIVSNFLDLIDKIVSTIESADPFEGFQQSADILLEITGTTHVSDALHILDQRLKSIRSLVQFVTEERNEELLGIINYLKEVRIPSAYKKLKTSYYQLMVSLIKNAEAILTSKESYDKFVSEFEGFREGYIEVYIEEHKLKNDLTKGFCKGFQDDIRFKLLKEMENIDKKLVSKSPESLRQEVIEYREECDTGDKELRNILVDYTRCTTCYHKLKGKEEIIREIKDQEGEFLSKIQDESVASLINLSSALKNNKLKFRELLAKENFTKEGDKLVEKIEKPKEVSPRDLEEILSALTVLKDILKKTLIGIEIAPPKPKPKAVYFSRIINELKVELGKRITVGELLKWLKQKLSEKEEIVVDV